jgi:hypothetical protein
MSVSQVIAACGRPLNRGSHLSGDTCHMMPHSLARGAVCEGWRGCGDGGCGDGGREAAVSAREYLGVSAVLVALGLGVRGGP